MAHQAYKLEFFPLYSLRWPEGCRIMSKEDLLQQWNKFTDDFDGSAWMKDELEIPFCEAHFRSFAEEREGAPWKALDVGCGMGKYTVKLMQAGANYVLAFDPSTDMVAGAQKATEEYLVSQSRSGNEKLDAPTADFHVCSAADMTSIPGTHEGSFDLAICIYVFCNMPSKEEVKQALVEISKLLKPGGKLLFYEPHILEYMSKTVAGHVQYLPKEDGTDYKYFDDEGTPRKLQLSFNTGRKIEIINRFYTLSFWVAALLEAGFQITQFREPHLDSRNIPADAPSLARYYSECATAMVWECTKASQ